MTEHEQREIASLIHHRLAEVDAAEHAAELTRARIERSLGDHPDQADAAFHREAARAASTRRAARAARLRSALHRMDRPDFGRCCVCGDAIPVGRLRADPGARRCPACLAPES